MTNQHPILFPPPELVREWENRIFDEQENVDVLLIEAYKAGADQELEACCKWLPKLPPWSADDLRRHRRPKPPSLKEQALKALLHLDHGQHNERCLLIRRALEALDD